MILVMASHKSDFERWDELSFAMKYWLVAVVFGTLGFLAMAVVVSIYHPE